MTLTMVLPLNWGPRSIPRGIGSSARGTPAPPPALVPCQDSQASGVGYFSGASTRLFGKGHGAPSCLQGSSGFWTSVDRTPWAALEPARPPPGPRSTHAPPTATRAPASGPATHAQERLKSRPTRSGPKVRTGFIDAPEIGRPNEVANPM